MHVHIVFEVVACQVVRQRPGIGDVQPVLHLPRKQGCKDLLEGPLPGSCRAPPGRRGAWCGQRHRHPPAALLWLDMQLALMSDRMAGTVTEP